MRSLPIIVNLFLVHTIGLVLTMSSYSQDKLPVASYPDKLTTQDVNSIPRTSMGRVEKVKVVKTAIEDLDVSANFIVKTEGYREAVVSLFGQAKAKKITSCRVGVVFLPNEKQILSAWLNDKSLVLAEEVATSADPVKRYFQGQIEMDIKFPSYLLGFYNTCDSDVELNVYTYLK